MERIRAFGAWIAEETVFWAEVLGEVMGLNRNKYTDIIEKRQKEIEAEEELERRRALYQRLSL